MLEGSLPAPIVGSPRRRRWLRRALLAALALQQNLACTADTSEPLRDASAPTIEVERTTSRAGELLLPARAGSVRFAVIGDSGRGNQPQYDVAAQMEAFRSKLGFDFVLMLGDNVYDGGTPRDYHDKFERPYAPLLAQGVRFYAALGNHDASNQRYYSLFHTGGERYHTFSRAEGLPVLGREVRFFALDTVTLDRAQIEWFERELAKSGAAWKICFFHHPIYTSGRYQRQARRLRSQLEPLFRKYGVRAAFSGHEHFYERLKPQHGIQYFVSGGASSLRPGDLGMSPSSITAAGNDRDYHFMLVEIAGEALYFQAVSRTGETIDAGRISWEH